MTREVTSHPSKEVAPGEHTRAGRTYLPNIDIVETEEELALYADLPGVNEDALDVRLVDDVLTIEGRVSPSDYEDLRPVYTEYDVGNFSRRFTISSAIDASRIGAKLVGGVLEVHLPKTEHARPRRIAVLPG